MEIPILQDIIIIFALSIAVIFVFSRIHLPSIVGFLLTGVLVGPYGLRLIGAVHEVEILAEIGVVLLLFSIGIEFSLKNLSKARTAIFAGGSLQVVITGLVGFVIAWRVGYSVGSAVFFGFLLALSSTAIVLKLLQDRAEIMSPHGRTSLSVLIYQDIIIVPMILVTPLLAGGKARFRRYNWPKDRLKDWVTIDVGGVTIIEGVNATRNELSDYYDLRIWFSCLRDVRVSRMLARRDTPAEEIKHWLPVEERYISSHAPEEVAHLVIDSTADMETKDGDAWFATRWSPPRTALSRA